MFWFWWQLWVVYGRRSGTFTHRGSCLTPSSKSAATALRGSSSSHPTGSCFCPGSVPIAPWRPPWSTRCRSAFISFTRRSQPARASSPTYSPSTCTATVTQPSNPTFYRYINSLIVRSSNEFNVIYSFGIHRSRSIDIDPDFQDYFFIKFLIYSFY